MEEFPIIVISLKDENERRNSMKSALDSLRLPFLFFDAVDGRGRLPSEYECKIDREAAHTRIGRPMSDAEFGCALSHAGVYQRMQDNNLKGGIILEDDAIIGENFKRFVLEKHYINHNMLFLAHSDGYAYRSDRKILFKGNTAWKLRKNPNRTTAYSLHSAVAEKILKLMNPIHRTADDWPCDLSNFGARIVHPSMVGFDDDAPSTINKRFFMTKRTKMKYLTSAYWNKKYKKIFWKRIPSSTKFVV